MFMLISSFFWMLYMLHIHVASVLSGCCIYFAMAFEMFLGVFASVLDVYCKCFTVLTYVTSVLSGCYKSRSDVAYIAMAIHVCCQCVFQMFHLFRTYVAGVYLDVAYVVVEKSLLHSQTMGGGLLNPSTMKRFILPLNFPKSVKLPQAVLRQRLLQ
jgi:hypothetical protein